MKYPKLRVIPTSRQMIDVFGGYNHNLRINENEFFAMKNMTSDFYPVLSPRGGRGVYLDTTKDPVDTDQKINGIIAKDALCYVDGSKFVINKYPVEMELEDSPKQLVSMGAYVIILPDKKYINTMNFEDRGNIEAENVTSDEAQISLVREDGTEYGDIPATDVEPDDPKNGDLWIDTSATPHTLRQYSSTSSLMWVTVATTYVRISAPNIGKGINAYDGITITGIKEESLNGSFIVQSAADNYVTVIAIIDEAFSQTEAITVSRKMPEIDYLTECGNRLWGCKYGLTKDGQIVNELYACKLGDFKNWECYMGISTDSWRGSVGTDGMFTGATTHMGYPVFFKENCLHKVYVSSVGAHQVQDTACRGVQQGCERSLAIVNETLYYKARNGIMAYDGALPVSVNYALGEVQYHDAIGVAHGSKYYVSMLDETNTASLFVYDTAKSMWHREDETRLLDFRSCNGELYAISEDRTQIITMTRGEEVVEWSVQTGEIGLSSPDMKFMQRITLRVLLPPGSNLDIFVQYGSESSWTNAFHTKSATLRSFSIPIRPKRCDFMRMRICGTGDAKIYAITKTMRNGSEIS